MSLSFEKIKRKSSESSVMLASTQPSRVWARETQIAFEHCRGVSGLDVKHQNERILDHP